MATKLASSVGVDTEERGHTRVCLTRIYLLTGPLVPECIGRPNVPVGASSIRNQTSGRKQNTRLRTVESEKNKK